MNEIRQLDDEEDLLTVGNSMIIPEDKTITLENVFFQYSSNAPVVLRNVFLIIPQGKVTAIVGG